MRRTAHQGMPPRKNRFPMRLPGQSSLYEGNVNQILFIVFRHGIENHVDPQMEGVSALLLTARSAGVDPLAQLISFPGASEVILAVDNRSSAPQRDPFEVRRHDLHPADAAQQIVTAQRRMP